MEWASRLRASLIAVGLVAGVLLAPAPSEAVIMGDDGPLAFDRYDGSQSDVYVMREDGSDERRLAGNSPTANDARPDWAPYTRAGAASARAVGAAPGDFVPHARRGAQVDVVVEHIPPGATVTAVSFNGARAAAGPLDANNATRVTVPADATSGPLCVEHTAPFVDGRDLVFSGSSDQQATIGFTVDGAPEAPPQAGCAESQPIAVQSNRTGDYDIWAIDPRSGAAANLTRSPGSNETAPAWSPTDAQAGITGSDFRTPRLALETDPRGNRDIAVLDPSQPLVAGRNPQLLTTDSADDANPDWAPDGSAITFESDRDGQKDIWVIARAADGTFKTEQNLTRITRDEPPSYEPSWTHLPDEFREGVDFGSTSAISFSGDDEGGSCELHYAAWANTVLPPEDRSLIVSYTVEGDPAKDDSPAWSPFGDTVAFHRTVGGRDTITTLVRGSGDRPDALAVLTQGRPGRDRHPAWQSRFYAAQPSFYRPLTRARLRRKRAPRAARLAQVTPGCSRSPVAALAIAPDSTVAVRTTVTFDARASHDPDGAIDSFEWDLDGDGNFERRGDDAVVRQRYATTGRRTVAVRVTDDDGVVDIARRVVIVNQTGDGGNGEAQCTKVGTSGPDRLVGTAGADVLCGLGGNDLLLGMGGRDRLIGGSGRDRLDGGRGRDRLRGGSGRDRLAAGDGGDDARGGAGNDAVAGDAGDDRVAGDSGDDVISGGTGSDRGSGGRGRDRLAGGPGADRLTGGPDGDRIVGGPGRDTLAGDGGADVLLARDRRGDALAGGRGRDRATADRRIDRIREVERVRRR